MYPSSDNTIVTTTAAISTRSFQEEPLRSDCKLANFIRLLLCKAEHLINTNPEKLHTK